MPANLPAPILARWLLVGVEAGVAFGGDKRLALARLALAGVALQPFGVWRSSGVVGVAGGAFGVCAGVALAQALSGWRAAAFGVCWRRCERFERRWRCVGRRCRLQAFVGVSALLRSGGVAGVVVRCTGVWREALAWRLALAGLALAAAAAAFGWRRVVAFVLLRRCDKRRVVR